MSMRCPRCGDEYEDHVSECAQCGVPLMPPGASPPPRTDALLGTFHPVPATQVLDLLQRRGIEHDHVEADGRVEVLVDREWRDDLRAELAVNWRELISRLPRDDMYGILSEGGRQPGWYDAPEGAWVDRDGRLKVEPAGDEELEADAARTVGPGLVGFGAFLVLVGWYVGGVAWMVVLGVGLVLTGVFLPR